MRAADKRITNKRQIHYNAMQQVIEKHGNWGLGVSNVAALHVGRTASNHGGVLVILKLVISQGDKSFR